MLFVYVTYPNAEEARRVSKIVVEQRLAACANIFPAHESLYWWEGAVQNAQEVAVIYKTATEKFEAFKERVVELHSYDVPCVVALSIQDGHGPFLEWIGRVGR